MNDRPTDLINEEAVYRTAPATPGLLNIWTDVKFSDIPAGDYHSTWNKLEDKNLLNRVEIIIERYLNGIFVCVLYIFIRFFF